MTFSQCEVLEKSVSCSLTIHMKAYLSQCQLFQLFTETHDMLRICQRVLVEIVTNVVRMPSCFHCNARCGVISTAATG